MSDRIVIVSRESKPLYISEGEEVRPHPRHEHVFGWLRRRCKICKKTRKEINQESK